MDVQRSGGERSAGGGSQSPAERPLPSLLNIYPPRKPGLRGLGRGKGGRADPSPPRPSPGGEPAGAGRHMTGCPPDQGTNPAQPDAR